MTKNLRLDFLNVYFRIFLHPDGSHENGAHYKHNEKKKQKGHSNDLRLKVIRQKEPRYPQHIHSLLSRFYLQPPFIEVLSALPRSLLASRFLVFFLFGVVLARPFFPHFSPVGSKAVQRSALCRSRRELSNEYLLAKIGVDTAENEPLEVWGANSIQYSIVSLVPKARRRSKRTAM